MVLSEVTDAAASGAYLTALSSEDVERLGEVADERLHARLRLRLEVAFDVDLAQCFAECAVQRPALLDLGGGRRVACHLVLPDRA